MGDHGGGGTIAPCRCLLGRRFSEGASRLGVACRLLLGLSLGEDTGRSLVGTVTGTLDIASVIGAGHSAGLFSAPLNESLLGLVLSEEASLTGIAARIPHIGVDGPRAYRVSVTPDNALVPDFPMGVVRFNVFPIGFVPLLARRRLRHLHFGFITVHGELRTRRGLARAVLIVLCIGGAGVLRVFIEGCLVHGDVSQDLVSGPSYREQPGLFDIGVHLVNAADTDPQAFVGFIEVHKGRDNVLPSPPGPWVQVVAQEETLYRLGLMLPQGLEDGLGGPEVDQGPERDELTGEMLMVPLVPGTRALLKEDVQHHNEVLSGVRPPTFGKAALLQYRARALVH